MMFLCDRHAVLRTRSNQSEYHMFLNSKTWRLKSRDVFMCIEDICLVHTVCYLVTTTGAEVIESSVRET